MKKIEEYYSNGNIWFRYAKDDHELRQGLCERWYENGQLAERTNYKNNKLDGLTERWYENGQKKERANYKDGNREGLTERWYSDKQLHSRAYYKDGKLDGISETWYDNGQLKSRISYKNNKLDGLYEWWDHNGNLRVINYKDGNRIDENIMNERTSYYANGQMKSRWIEDEQGRIQGLCEIWYENGQKKEKANFKDDKLEGLTEVWYMNGQLKSKDNYKDGNLDGLCESWYENGAMKYSGIYKDGEPIAEYYKNGSRIFKNTIKEKITYYPNGQMNARWNEDENGLRQGLFEWWNKDGQLKMKAIFKDDQKDGIAEWWYDNGKLESRTIYKNGKRDGLLEWWYDNGKLKKRLNYKKGRYDGLCEWFYDDGQLKYSAVFKNGELFPDYTSAKMPLSENQDKVESFNFDKCNNLAYGILGLAESVGELQGELARQIRKGNISFNNNDLMMSYGFDCDSFKEKLKQELGDILCFVTHISKQLGFSVEDIRKRDQQNI